MRGSAKAV
jgi:hypothetical protein